MEVSNIFSPKSCSNTFTILTKRYVNYTEDDHADPVKAPENKPGINGISCNLKVETSLFQY